jgi:acyl carrier protein
LHGDELFVTGRLKDLIIVNGANYYPQDIEAVAEKAHPALRHDFGAAFSVDAEGRECLVIQYEVDRHHRNASDAEFKEIADAIRTAIHQEFELEVYAVQLLKVGGIQKTSSGKIQRQLCRGDFLAGTSDVLFESKLRRELDGSLDEMDGLNRAELFALKPSERGPALQERLRMHVARVLRMPWRQIDPTEPLGSYGLESLQGSQLIADIEDSLGVILPSTTIFDYPSVAELSRFLGRLMDLTGETETVSTNHENGRRKGSVEHHGLAEFLGAVEQVSVSEMQEMISKQTGEKRRRDAAGLTD